MPDKAPIPEASAGWEALDEASRKWSKDLQKRALERKRRRAEAVQRMLTTQ